MSNKQYNVCVGVLRRLHDAGVLEHLVLIGSWCLVLYREYFRDVDALPAVRTRDMDFLVPSLTKPRRKVDVPGLLEDFGFIAALRGQSGVMLLQHPELLIEFLVPEKGRGGAEVQAVPRLGVNAQPLRFMGIALMKVVKVHFDDIPVNAPHPAAFALHKLLIAPRRASREKGRKDVDAAFLVLDLLEKKGEMGVVRNLLAGFPRPWRKNVLATIERHQRSPLAQALNLV